MVLDILLLGRVLIGGSVSAFSHLGPFAKVNVSICAHNRSVIVPDRQIYVIIWIFHPNSSKLMAIEDAIFRRTELLKERLLSINPQAHITAIFGFMLAGWLSEIYYRPAVIVPYYLTGYEHAVVAACLLRTTATL